MKNKKNLFIAVMLSMIPGLGHLYLTQYKKAFLFFFGYIIFIIIYSRFVVPALNSAHSPDYLTEIPIYLFQALVIADAYRYVYKLNNS